MEPTAQSWQESLNLGFTYTVAQFSIFLPRIIGAIAVLLIGFFVAKVARRIVVRALEALRVSRMIEKTPLDLFLKNAEFGQKLEEILGGICYWFLILIVLHTSVSLLGLTSLSGFMDRVLSYVPHLLSAVVIFLLGVLLSGVVESFIKGAVRNVDPHSARLFAKIGSYAVLTITVLAAIAELGIASEFIKILFLGVVSAFALGMGLAFGLGGQHTVKKIMEKWYDTGSKE